MSLEPLGLVALRGRPIVAVPWNRPAAHAGVLAWHAFSPKRRVVRAALGGLSAAGLLPTVARRADVGALPNMAGRERLIESCSSALKATHLTVSWPSQLERGRAYVQFLDADGRPVGFLKMAPTGQALAFRREADALRHFADEPCPSFATPRILDQDLSDAATVWLLTEPARPSRRMRFTRNELRQLSTAIARGTVLPLPRDEVAELPWWKALQISPHAAPEFIKDLEHLTSGGLEVSRVHGDFGPHNVMGTPQSPVLVDWEASSPHGPAGSDYWFSQLISRPFHEVREDARACGPKEVVALVATIGYATALDVGSVSLIAKNWTEFSEGPTS